LSVKEPDTTAFTTADIDYRVQGDVIYMDHITLNGDLISLKGRGEMNLERQINLYFYSLVGRHDLHVPIVTPALGLASRQILLIHAGGTLDQPEVSRKAFPGINDTLQQMFPEVVNEPAPRAPSLPRPREALERSGLLPRR
jgi:hypothetical protein